MCDWLPTHIPGHCPPMPHPDLSDPDVAVRIEHALRQTQREQEDRKRAKESIPDHWMAL